MGAERKARQNAKGGDADDDKLETAEGDLELLADVEDDEKGFNHRGPQRAAHSRGRKAKDDGDTFKVDVDDPRIAKVFSTPDFEIDPTNPEFRKSAGMNEVLRKKRKRKTANDAAAADSLAAPKSQIAAASEMPAPIGHGFGGLQLFGGSNRRQDDRQ